MFRLSLAVSVVVLFGCAPEIRMGAEAGVPPLVGSTEFSLPNFVCGQTITFDGIAVPTKKVTGGCEISLDRTLQLLSVEEYGMLGELKGAANLLTTVELDVRALDFIDSKTGSKLDPNVQLRATTVSINGQQVADRELLSKLPAQIRLEGKALDPLRLQMEAQKPVSIRLTAVVTLTDSPKPPERMRVVFDAQPTFVLVLR